MSKKWDKKYSEPRQVELKPPSNSLVEFMERLPRGRALDLACGTGRNAIFLAGNGYEVDAVDSSSVAIEKGQDFASGAGVPINFICADLDSYRITPDHYDLIICFNYLDRSLAPQIIKALKKGGMLLYETYTEKQKAIGPPFNDDYLLKSDELPRLFKGLSIHVYREGPVHTEGRQKEIATLLASQTG